MNEEEIQRAIFRLKAAFKLEVANESESPVLPLMRFRAPFAQSPHHDVYFDAFGFVFELCTDKSVPWWTADMLARRVAAAYCQEAGVEIVTDHPVIPEEVTKKEDGASMCKKLMAMTTLRAGELVKNYDKLELPTQGVPFSIAADRHRRPKMEDKWTVAPRLSISSHSAACKECDGCSSSVFAVFDGHGGSECATYAASRIAHLVSRESCRNLAKKSNGAAKEGDGPLTKENSPLIRAISQLDDLLTARCKSSRWHSGTTMVATQLWPGSRNDANETTIEFVDIAWLGDSAIYLIESSQAVLLTRPHSPEDGAEAARVLEAGGQLLWIQGDLRVNGILNLTRSLGDVCGRPMISSEPEALRLKVEPGQYALLLACDGVADSLTNQQIHDAVRDYCRTHSVEQHSGLSEALLEVTRKTDSTDNLTALVVYLRSPAELWSVFNV